MAEFTLPADSVVGKGQHYASPQASRCRVVEVYRWQPNDMNNIAADQNPVLDSFEIDLDDCGPMVLDALFYIKNKLDSSLAFRRSCREGVCGSCAMHINGRNTLACTQALTDLADPIRIYPLPHMTVLKDLVIDLSHFYAQYASIKPWLQSDTPVPPDRERLQSKQERAQLDGLYECILCACCSTSCPSYWWNGDRFLGPASLLQTERWLQDSRDEYSGDRLHEVEDSYRLFRCHTILNCSNTCPKGLNPGKAIANIKRSLVLRK